MEMREIKKGNNIVKKSEQLIESRYSLTATEIKIISQLITMVKISDTSFHEYAFRVVDWKNEQELKRKNIYKAFKDIARDLMSKPLTIRSIDGESWLVVNWVSSARYVKGSGIIKFKISDELKPYLLTLKEHFLQYDIKNILPLKSAYAIRMYELLKDWYMTETRYKKVEKTVTKIIEIDWLRQTFQIPAVYKWQNIKQRILEKARIDLAKYTDLIFAYEKIKEGRKVTHIKFTIQQIRQEQIKQEPEILSDQRIEHNQQKNMMFLLPEQYQTAAAEKLLNRYISKGIKYIKAQIKKTTMANPQNYLAYLHSALDYDFAGTEQATAEAEAEAVAESREIAKEQEEKEERKKTIEQDKKNLERWHRLPPEEQEKYVLKAASKSRWVRLNMEKREEGKYTHGVQLWGIKMMLLTSSS